MPDAAALLTFLTALLILEITPGPDMMLVLARGIGQVLDDFDRILDHLVRLEAADTSECVAGIIGGLEVLAHSPEIGRPVRDGKRELVIGRGTRGHVALYRYVASVDTAFVLAVRAQREGGYRKR